MRSHKFGAVRTTVDNISFSSKKEARRYAELKLLERTGKISLLILQPRYPLAVNDTVVATYVADFSYHDEEKNKLVVEDVKGIKLPLYLIKKRLVKALYGIEITET